MVIEQMIEAGMAAFKKALSDWWVEGELTVDSAHVVTQGIQAALAAAGRAAFREYLESKEIQDDVLVVDDERYRFKYRSEKRFQTLWGPLTLTRRLYQNAPDSKTHVPLDAAWGMTGQFMTIEVREAAAYSCALMTAEETHELLKKSALFHPHPTQIKRCVEAIGAQIAHDPLALEARLRAQETAPEGTCVLVASLDGVNVLLHDPEEKGAKRGRPAARPVTRETRASTTAYHNAMVGSVSFYGDIPPGEKTPQRLISRYVSHMPEENAPTFKAKFEAELADAEHHVLPGTTKVMLCDGARVLWNYIRQQERYNDYEKLVDYCHTLEHLSLAAEALFGPGSAARTWYDKYRRILLEEDDGACGVIRSMDYYARKNSLSPTSHKGYEKQRTFFLRNKTLMTYTDFRGRGLPIGSGPVEAACKSLVKTRMCRSGMRWTCKGGQNILALRTFVKSKRWDPFWNEYKDSLAAA